MNKQTVFTILTIVIICITGAWIWINQPPPNLQKATTQARINAEFLTQSYVKNEEQTNQDFKGKVIEVTGIVHQINALNQRNTIVLKGFNPNTYVLCDFGANQQNNITIGQQIKIKGMCKGFLKDVILLNCILINKNDNEKN